MIFVTGDCHGSYNRFSMASFPQQKEMDRQDFVIVCGDFGYWDRSKEQEYWMNWLGQKDFTVLFVDGNHENYDLLAELPVTTWRGGRVQMIRENVIHLLRGQMFTLQGRRFFTFGGAKSHDVTDGILEADDPDLRRKVKRLEGAGALYRINHLSWWKEEMPSEAEYEEGRHCLAEHGWKCDYILSHCAPTGIQAEISCGRFSPDALTDYLEEIRSQCEYKRWYFGHYHDDMAVDDRHILMYNRLEQIT